MPTTKETLDGIFNEIADLKNQTHAKTPCPDQYVGLIGDDMKFKRNTINYNNDFSGIDGTIDLSTNGNVLVLIIEAPQVDEFDEDTKIGPAKGTTEENICNFLPKIKNLGNSENIKDYHLILVNAVQYQCSLGISPIDKDIRNSVFKAFWEKNKSAGKENFKARLKAIVTSLTKNNASRKLVIANCSTGGLSEIFKGNEGTLNYVVHKAIEEDATLEPFYRIIANHPCSWLRDNRNRKLHIKSSTDKKWGTSEKF